MVGSRTGLHHLHKRKRIYQKYEKYPNKNKLKRVFDKFMFAVALVGPIMGLPQLIKVWTEKNTEGLSSISWSAFFLLSLFWVIYGFLHKDKPIIISSIAWTIIHMLIVIGIIIF